MLKDSNNFRSNFLSIFILVIGALAIVPAQGKDLKNRLGIGYKNQFGTELPGISAQYYPSKDLGMSIVVGVDTQRANSKFGFLAKVHRVIFPEDNLNFYMGAGAGLISYEQTGTTESGFELIGFAGSEFFLSGLENLSLSAEVGVAVTSIASGVRFRTMGDHPLRAGITFYF